MTSAPDAQAAPAEPAPVLEARDLVLRYRRKGEAPVTALDGVGALARPGAVTGLVGPDGAGKTTLLRLAAGLLVADAGSLTVLGRDPRRALDAIRPRLGYMPQQFGLYEELTVRENLDLHADLQGVARSLRAERYDELLAMTGLGPFTARRAGRLSGGMKQKLGLACCLVRAPDLLLLDEPTVGVDPVSRRDLWAIVQRLVRDDGLAVVLATAYLDEAEGCDHVTLLHEGKKLAEGPPDAFHEPVRGRVSLLEPDEGVAPRRIQAELAARPDVVDATIRSGRVRVVWRSAGAERARPAGTRALRPVDPVFEDAFVDRLAEAGARRSPPPAIDDAAPSSENGEIVVRVRGLTKRFGAFEAVSGIRFDVARGEIFGLLGPNGAGKSTTFRMLCGLVPASDGEIGVAGRDLRRARAAARARLGYMAQKFSLYQQLAVASNLRFYGRAYGLRGRRLRERVDWALDEFALRGMERAPAGALPGGFRQRLAMAVATLHEPEILFLDEPTSGADPLARREFWLRINGFARAGVTVIVTTHFMEEAEYCDRMLIMARGTELAKGDPATIRALAAGPENPKPSMEDAFIHLAGAAPGKGPEQRPG